MTFIVLFSRDLYTKEILKKFSSVEKARESKISSKSKQKIILSNEIIVE